MSKILIAGGGIGGLAAALACARTGTEVSLFERAPAFSEVGAGIQLSPNIVRVLHDWGLKAALEAVVAVPDRLQVRSAMSGTELGVLRLGATIEARYGSPYVTIQRADLHNLLLAELTRRDQVLLSLKSEVAGFSQSDEGVSLRLSDGRAALGDALIGADGGFSLIRRQLLNDGVPAPTGQLAYRAMIAQSSLPAHMRSQHVTAWLGPNLHVVQYPVRRGDYLNVVAIVHGTIKGDLAYWDHNANGPQLQRLMAGTGSALQAMIAAIPDWRLWGLSIRPPMAGAHEQAKGRVALLGDAAHPMLPYLAQGAGMAIEDALVLAKVLHEPKPVTGGALSERLAQYAAKRWQRNARVQSRAIRNGKIFHASGPTRWGRNAAMKVLGERLLDVPWLYRGVAA
ncbi:FAD-dependent monooxygenase [Rhodoferax sp. PAMC 29310]|uniref:FAD-dependent monooxygenase n=1 Tax=Rhodoferax sp. PAMC 29310 TaxID=2822760 RepID=UPI001B3371E9|nr:FAD-dependent monooxygenase [Rhodoferax sp. PAMC 29310]